jgi:hypothetical protein
VVSLVLVSDFSYTVVHSCLLSLARRYTSFCFAELHHFFVRLLNSRYVKSSRVDMRIFFPLLRSVSFFLTALLLFFAARTTCIHPMQLLYLMTSYYEF